MQVRTASLYILAFAATIVLDIMTPLSIADWLIEVTLVWIASVRGSAMEMLLVASAGTGAIVLGLWSSPYVAEFLPIAAFNRSVAIAIIWMIVAVGRKRTRAEKARNQVTAHLRILEGLLPICSACKAIRDDAGEWHRIETYLSAHSEARLTHSLCPPCADKYMADLYAGAQD